MLQIQETYIDDTRSCQIGASDWFEPWTDDRGQLFRALQREYGGCVSKVYRDVPRPASAHLPAPAVPIAARLAYDVVPVGWVFSRRERYEDARGPADTYIREVWVTLREVPDSAS